MLGMLVLAIWVLTAESTIVQCQDSCKPLRTMTRSVQTFPTEAECLAMLHQFRAHAPSTVQAPSRTDVHQEMSWTCARGTDGAERRTP
jgi:hypothetical protein